jgi:hypothetical protein
MFCICCAFDRLDEKMAVEEPDVNPRILEFGNGATTSCCRVSAGAQHPLPILVTWEGVSIPRIRNHKKLWRSRRREKIGRAALEKPVLSQFCENPKFKLLCEFRREMVRFLYLRVVKWTAIWLPPAPVMDSPERAPAHVLMCFGNQLKSMSAT